MVPWQLALGRPARPRWGSSRRWREAKWRRPGPAGPACSPAAAGSGPRRPGPARRSGRSRRPGAPLRASTHRPESSAMAGRPLASHDGLGLEHGVFRKGGAGLLHLHVPAPDPRTGALPPPPAGTENVPHLRQLVPDYCVASTSFMSQYLLPDTPSAWPISSRMPLAHRLHQLLLLLQR